MSKKGSLLIELLISMAVFTILGSLLVMLIYQDQFLITSNSLRSKTLIIAKDHLDSVLNDIKNNFDLVSSTSTDQGYQVVTTILPVDNFTTSVQVNVFYKLMNRLVSSAFSASVTDTRESEGQSSCRPTQDKMKWKLPVKSIIDLSSFINSGNDITDSDVVGNYLYLATNSAITTDADLYIFDISNYSSPLLLSSLDTGPGLLSLAVAGHFAYLGNTSINKQLQIVDVSNKTNPQFISSFKIP